MFLLFINGILWGFGFAFNYLDVIFSASSSTENHVSHLTQLFEKLKKLGKIVIAEKCMLRITKTNILVAWWMWRVLAPGQMSHFQYLFTLYQLRRYLGILNFDHWLPPEITKTLFSLTTIQEGKCKPKNPRITLTSEASQALVSIQYILIDAVDLHSWDPVHIYNSYLMHQTTPWVGDVTQFLGFFTMP